MGHDFIEERASQLAYGLDVGQGAHVAKQLREDALNMNERDFASLVYRTQAYERPGVGDDLRIRDVQGGQAVSVESVGRDRNGPYVFSIPAGHIEFPPVYNEPPAYEEPREGNRGIDGKSAVIGAVVGAVIEHQLDKHNDNHDHRNDQREDHRNARREDHRDDRRRIHENDREVRRAIDNANRVNDMANMINIFGQ